MQDFSSVLFEFWEAVEVDAVAFLAFIDFQETALAHSRVDFVHGYGERLSGLVVAELVPVEDEAVSWSTEGQDVVGGPLIEEVHLALVVLVRRESVVVGILMVVHNPLNQSGEQCCGRSFRI